MKLCEGLATCLAGKDLSEQAMAEIVQQIMLGAEDDIQIAAFLTAMHMKGECLEELVGAARTMRALSMPIVIDLPNMVDIVGTGGDGAHLFNVSTASAFVAAAAGSNVAKHGGRAVSGVTGSADILKCLGVDLAMPSEKIVECIKETGVGFMFAPVFHASMKEVAGVRKALGFRTIFNILGPMTNPAGVKRLVVGVFSKKLVSLVAKAFSQLGAQNVLVVHSEDGVDEISIAARTHVGELCSDGTIREYILDPEEFGIPRDNLEGLSVANANESFQLICEAFEKQPKGRALKASNIITLNAGAAIYTSGIAYTFAEGVLMAKEMLRSGQALRRLQDYMEFFKKAG